MATTQVRTLKVGFLAAVLVLAPLQTGLAEADNQLDVIVPLGEGGALDRFARTAEQFLPNVMDVDVSVENFAPNSGRDGYREFLNRSTDRSTVLAWFEPAAAAYQLGVALDDLTIINVQEIEPPILVANRDVGWRSLDDMVTAIRETPNTFRFGFGSRTGGGALLTATLLNNLDLEIIEANYASGGKARKALAKGEVDLTAGSLNAIRKLGDQVTPLAVFSPRRLRAWPEVPTVQEALGADSDQAIQGAVYRFFAVRRTFAEAKPEAFRRLVQAFRRMTEEDPAFLANADRRGVGAQWLGPIASTSLIQRAHQHFSHLIARQQRR
ncbi:MAG: tripartite tricarboxylate transporter substrate-binding protein [Geminicoccaceae bacterium]